MTPSARKLPGNALHASSPRTPMAAVRIAAVTRAAKIPSTPTPARSPPRYRNTSTTGFALYFSDGETTLNSVSLAGREIA